MQQSSIDIRHVITVHHRHRQLCRLSSHSRHIHRLQLRMWNKWRPYQVMYHLVMTPVYVKQLLSSCMNEIILTWTVHILWECSTSFKPTFKLTVVCTILNIVYFRLSQAVSWSCSLASCFKPNFAHNILEFLHNTLEYNKFCWLRLVKDVQMGSVQYD